MYLKRIPADWHKKMAHTLPNYVSKELTDIFTSTLPTTVGDFCLEIYRKMGLLEGVQVIRSGDSSIRNAACEIPDYFVDIPYQNEIVRARLSNAGILPAPTSDVPATQKSLQLHEGGPNFITLTFPDKIEKSQISPTRDTRLKWMQSVLHCTHYVAGAGEQQYLNKSDAPEITFLNRDPIDRLDEAWTEAPPVAQLFILIFVFFLSSPLPARTVTSEFAKERRKK